MGAIAAGHRRLIVVCLFLSSLIPSAAASSAAAPVDTATVARIAGLGVPFVANHGQSDPRVAFVARTFTGTVFVTHDGRIVYSMASARDRSDKLNGWAISETFAGQH